MYSENQRNTCARRANDEFLRRMLGGELAGNGDASRSGACGSGCGVDQRDRQGAQGGCGCGRDRRDSQRRCCGCGDRRDDSQNTGGQSNGNSRFLCGGRRQDDDHDHDHSAQGRPSTPPCNSGDLVSIGASCAWNTRNTSLAMVYSPIQGFQNLYEPCDALKHGTLFHELNLPFEGCKGKEGCARRCDS